MIRPAGNPSHLEQLLHAMESAVPGKKTAAGPIFHELATRLTKESLNRGIDMALSDAVLGDLYRFAMLEMTEDKQEAHQAWRERRKPCFKGN